MSSLSSMALPGRIPVAGPGSSITPESLFGHLPDGAGYQRIGESHAPGIKVKKVKVEVFDLSDKKQVRAYEKLWAYLLEKTAKMEVVVDHHKDLVRRPDGTSYWMKYVEYVEFGEAETDSSERDANRVVKERSNEQSI